MLLLNKTRRFKKHRVMGIRRGIFDVQQCAALWLHQFLVNLAQFDLRRRNFVADMVRRCHLRMVSMVEIHWETFWVDDCRGATVHFDIRHVSGGRTGAVASRTGAVKLARPYRPDPCWQSLHPLFFRALSARSTVLRVPSTQARFFEQNAIVLRFPFVLLSLSKTKTELCRQNSRCSPWRACIAPWSKLQGRKGSRVVLVCWCFTCQPDRLNNCDAHAVLGLGLALERLGIDVLEILEILEVDLDICASRVNPSSVLADWIKLLPLTFANVGDPSFAIRANCMGKTGFVFWSTSGI